MKNTGKKFLSDIKLHSDYLKWKDGLGRYETWEEACLDILDGHRKRYEGIDIEEELASAYESMKEMKLLASQRNLQFRHESIKKHNMKLFNCCTIHICRPRVFQEIFYMLLCGSGLGASLLRPFVYNLPKISERTGETKTFVIPDSIEGWADAIGVLMSSYFVDSQPFPEYSNCKIRFDYSQIRPRGSYISGGFKAPGPNGLKVALEKIEDIIEKWLVLRGNAIEPILAYDIICHISDSVLSGGLRRSALSMIVDINDEEMTMAKTGNWRQENPQRARSNNSVLLIRNEVEKEQFEKLVALNNGDNDIGFVFADNNFQIFNPCFEIGMTPINTYEGLDNIPYDKIQEFCKNNLDLFGSQQCNLCEINAEKIKTKEEFLRVCKDATVLGTLQAGYTNFPYMTKATEDISNREALLGVSITGWMNNPKMFSKEWLNEGAEVCKAVNKEFSKKIGINQAARITTTKPSGNACTKFSTSIKTELGDMTLLEIFRYCLGIDSFELNDKHKDLALTIYRPLKVFDENNQLQEISGLYINGIQDIYEIEFEDGNIYGFTANHKLKTTSGWKFVSELSLDDEIISF